MNRISVKLTGQINLFVLCISTILLTDCSGNRSDEKAVAEQIGYTVRNILPHDTQSFTQGFVVHEGQLYESTGQNNSWIGIVNIKTGKPDKKIELPAEYFGEGITILNNKIYQLTWKNKTGFIYDLRTYEPLDTFTYTTEGWGITHNGVNLIMSDGTNTLYFLDTANLSVVKQLDVNDNGTPITNLNELEFVNGTIYANIWKSNSIALIDAETGSVTGYLDLRELAQRARLKNRSIDALNGIAWHPGTGLLLITGKFWPEIYVIEPELK